VVETKFPREYFHWEPNIHELFPREPRETYFIACVSTDSFFYKNYFSKTFFLWKKLKNEVPSENILAIILFLTVVTAGTKENHIF
jgi:hypothetical protein